MKKIVFAMSLLFVFSSAVYSADPPKFGIGARVGHNFYKDGTFDFSGPGISPASVDYSNKSVWVYGLNATYRHNEYFSLEFALDRLTKSQNDFKVAGAAWNGGDIKQTPLTVTARFHWPIGIFSPYIGAGLGYYWNSYDINNGIWDPGTALYMDNSVGYHVNAGSEVFLDVAKKLALNVDFKYVWNKADITATNAGDRITGSMRLDSFVVGLGVKYYF